MIIGILSAQDILQVMVHLIQVRKAFNILKTILRNEANFISYQVEYIGESTLPDGTFTMSVNSTGTKLTVKQTNNTEFIFTKVTDSFLELIASLINKQFNSLLIFDSSLFITVSWFSWSKTFNFI